jgi:hypothetical protein
MILTKKENIIMYIIKITMIKIDIIIKIMNQNHISLIVQIKKLITMLELKMKKMIQSIIIIITMIRISFIQPGGKTEMEMNLVQKNFMERLELIILIEKKDQKKIMKI